MRTDPYSAAMAFIRGEFSVAGDLVEAVRQQLLRAAGGWRTRLLNTLGRLAPWRLAQIWESRAAAARRIRFHYDRSEEFYSQFLDPRMVYSCAYFRDPRDSLEQAQLAKLNHVCRKLRLAPGDRFLDIGCGWGALILHAARRFLALSTGCTLSRCQAGYAAAEVRRSHLEDRVSILEMDYRDMTGRFDKIASIGMVEHVGRAKLGAYFRKVYEMLLPNGLFLNHGITRPASVVTDAQGMFVARRVFPFCRLVNLSDMTEEAEKAGFEVLDIEGLRGHYALTCRAWVERLRARREACLAAVDERTWRTWQLYLAGSALAFEEGGLAIYQMLLSKRGAGEAAPMTREYMYAGH
ncbi:MAG: class I SAM-dependent methyltransferase [Acidobacteria bacterium]|nr:class I SAM-dependent methyltransferase [Acidobacteriota bacterium]